MTTACFHPSKTVSVITQFPREGGDLKGPQVFVWKPDMADRKKEGALREEGWLMGNVGLLPAASRMYLGAAKAFVILMSSAYCNLTWEFKSCLSFAFLMSLGSHILHKEEWREMLVGLRFQADVSCTSLCALNWDEPASCSRKKKVIWQRFRHFTAICLTYEVVDGSSNSQMTHTLVRVINQPPLLRDLFVSSSWYTSRLCLMNLHVSLCGNNLPAPAC